MHIDSSKSVTNEEIEYIRDAVTNRKKVVFTSSSLTDVQRDKFLKILQLFLEECDQQDLYNYLSYCLLELLDNANRANAKRVYFQENKLDINNEADYKKGMPKFKEMLSDRSNDFMKKLNTSELTVRLLLTVEDDITIQVTNNTKITDVELKRINEKINKAKTYNTLQDAMGDIDQTEGCGFGIISIILMLKKINPNAQCLNFTITETETIATIEVPINTFADLTEI